MIEHRHRDTDCALTNALREHRTALGRELLGIAQTADLPFRIENHRRRHHRPRQRPSTRLIDSRDQRLQCLHSRCSIKVPPEAAPLRAAPATRAPPLPRARPRQRAAAGVNARELARQQQSPRRICDQALDRRAEISWDRRLLKELRHERPAREQVRHRELRHPHQPQRSHQQRRRSAHAICNHHRAAAQQRLERRGARGHQRHVRRHQGRSGLPVQHPYLHRRDTAGRGGRERAPELRPYRVISHGRDDLKPTVAGTELRGAVDEGRRDALHLPDTAAGQDREHGAIGGEPERCACCCAIDRHRHLIGERVPDEARACRIVRIELGFERQQAQHQVTAPSNGARATLPPRPDLRADILHRCNAARLEARREVQVERRRIDADKHRRLPGEQARQQHRAQPP